MRGSGVDKPTGGGGGGKKTGPVLAVVLVMPGWFPALLPEMLPPVLAAGWELASPVRAGLTKTSCGPEGTRMGIGLGCSFARFMTGKNKVKDGQFVTWSKALVPPHFLHAGPRTAGPERNRLAPGFANVKWAGCNKQQRRRSVSNPTPTAPPPPSHAACGRLHWPAPAGRSKSPAPRRIPDAAALPPGPPFPPLRQ